MENEGKRSSYWALKKGGGKSEGQQISTRPGEGEGPLPHTEERWEKG